jgi:trehalose 6-phosphate phosphatase
VPKGLVTDIERIERALGGALALISGRTIADLDRLFRPLCLRASGVHGAETRYESSAASPTIEIAKILSRDLWLSLNATLSAFPGTLAENKRYSFAVHYRAAPALRPALRTALREWLVAAGEPDLEIINAHFAFEIKGREFDKGSAIERFLALPPFRGRVPIFIGDDWTDEAGFAAVARSGGTAYSVGEARPHVSGVFSGPPRVREWLAQAAAEMAQS